MKLLTRYLFRQLLAPTLLALVAFAGAVWVSQALRFVDLIVNQGLSVLAFLYLTGLLVPSLVLVVLPFAAFIGALAGYQKLRAESELSVCRAAGLSDWQLAKGAMVLGSLFMVVSLVVSLYVMPSAYRHFRTLQHDLSRDVSAVAIQTGVFTSLTSGLTVHVSERLPSGELGGILVHDTRRPHGAVTLLADRGDLVRGATGPLLVLREGSYQERARDGSLSVVYFDDTTVDLTAGLEDDFDRALKTREMFLGELFATAAVAENQRQRRLMLVEAHERLSWPLVSLALPLLAAATVLGNRAVRDGGWRVSLLATAMAIGVVALTLTTNNVAKNDLALLPALYAVPLVAIALAVFTLLRGGLVQPVPRPRAAA
ncbi:MAG: LptF/LptG family permease [Geminicoccaceae bacterium]|nr:MAG: LptF/LptG family permease [Geminicoccaceae bacterium]